MRGDSAVAAAHSCMRVLHICVCSFRFQISDYLYVLLQACETSALPGDEGKLESNPVAFCCRVVSRLVHFPFWSGIAVNESCRDGQVVESRKNVCLRYSVCACYICRYVNAQRKQNRLLRDAGKDSDVEED